MTSIMKILRANDFVSERIQLQPITNSELKQAQKDLAEKTYCAKINKPTFADIRKGNTVYVETDKGCTAYIVFDIKTLPLFLKSYLSKIAFDNNPEIIMIRYDKSTQKCCYRNVEPFRNEFPYRENYDNVKIIGIYSTNINVDGMKTFEDLNRVWTALCEKIKNIR